MVNREDSRLHWRQIRQEKALRDYRAEVDGPTYTNPTDRQEYLAAVSDGQKRRHSERYELLKQLGELNADSITADKVAVIQSSYTTISENEIQVPLYTDSRGMFLVTPL
jgi:hypothetical protein